MTSCDKEAELKDTSYKMSKVSFKYPYNARDYYTIKVNGQDTGWDGTVYLPVNVSSVNLEVLEKETGTSVFTMNDVSMDQSLNLIKIPGKQIDVYSEDKYSLVNVSILDEQGRALSADDFTASFNGQDLDFSSGVGTDNYFLKEDLEQEGLFILKDKNGTELYKQSQIALKANGTLTVMKSQYSSSGFLYFPSIDDPVDKYHPILRFLYFNEGKDSFKGAIKLKIKLYSKNNKTPSLDKQFIGETELLPGLISDGVTIDLNKYWPGLMGGQIPVEIIKIKSDGNEEKLLSIDDKKYVGANTMFKLQTILLQNTNPEGNSDEDFDPKKLRTKFIEQLKW